MNIPHDQIADFCERWRITEFAFFGSVLQDDFGPDSDIDVLVSFAPDAPWGLVDFVHMQRELEDMLGRRVDLVEKSAVEKSDNYIRREAVLTSARVVHER